MKIITAATVIALLVAICASVVTGMAVIQDEVGTAGLKGGKGGKCG